MTDAPCPMPAAPLQPADVAMARFAAGAHTHELHRRADCSTRVRLAVAADPPTLQAMNAAAAAVGAALKEKMPLGAAHAAHVQLLHENLDARERQGGRQAARARDVRAALEQAESMLSSLDLLEPLKPSKKLPENNFFCSMLHLREQPELEVKKLHTPKKSQIVARGCLGARAPE